MNNGRASLLSISPLEEMAALDVVISDTGPGPKTKLGIIKMSVRPLLAVLLAVGVTFGSTLAQAETVYKYRDKAGGVLFTDRGTDQVSNEYVLLSVRKGWTYKTGKLTDAKRDQFDPEIQYAASSYSVNPELIKSVIHAESLFDPFAVSRVGAQGLMQLMPETASYLRVYDPFDARQNIQGGARFLSYLMGKFDKIEHVLAAYNAGEGNVRRYGGIPPFKETQGYVKKVMELMPRYKVQLRPRTAALDEFAANN